MVTRRTIGPIIGTAADATIIAAVTVPTRITHWRLNNGSTTAAAAALALNGSTATAGNCILGPNFQVPGAGPGTGDVDRYCSHVLAVGGTLHANLATSVTITIDIEELVVGV